MRKWLAPAVVLPLLVVSAAHAQTKRLATAPPGAAATSHSPAFRLLPQQHFDDPARFANGTIAAQELAPNASVDFGLTSMIGRKKRALRINDEPVRARKPAVTLHLKF